MYDFDLGLSYLYPYLGAGVGDMHVDRPLSLPSSGVFAYQGIAGVSVPIALVPGLSATIEYRFLGLEGSKSSQFAPANFAIELVDRLTTEDAKAAPANRCVSTLTKIPRKTNA